MKFRAQKKIASISVFLLFISLEHAFSQTYVLDKHMNHLRAGNHQEWSGFPKAWKSRCIINFRSTETSNERTISLRQEDVKQNWLLRLNGKDLGKLKTDENPMIVYWAVQPGMLKTGLNSLVIEPTDTTADDILVGKVALINCPLQQLFAQAKVEISVINAQTGHLFPARITIANKDGVLQMVGAAQDQYLAIRPGCIYTGTGKASFGLPAGTYTVYANHGFEYGVDSVKLVVNPGTFIKKTLVISREVLTEGLISSDTHIHTFTYSGHGDASVQERVLTIAGEGIELPVLTDHNVKVNIDSLATKMKMRKYFTPVVGYEFTTPVGHFNIFPTATNTHVPDYSIHNWTDVARNLHSTDSTSIVILNHARDIHSGFRPFDPQHHISIAGADLMGWEFPANGMEVINSGALQTDYMSLYKDWFGMLNRGYWLTPVGSSDSHTVGQYLLGQARTYIKNNDIDPGNINVADVVKNFRKGKVMVSYGLLTEIIVNKKYGAGDIVPLSSSGELNVSVKVMGPGWTRANHIVLYANGVKIREEVIPDGGKAGLKFNKTWILPNPRHDMFLVAVAEGPGGNKPFWPVVKPFQPTSPNWVPRVIGSTGAIWVDADGDGQRTSASIYANKLLEAYKGNIDDLIQELASYDQAVAVQVAVKLQEQGQDLSSPAFCKALEKAAPFTKSGFKKFRLEYQVSKRRNSNNIDKESSN